MKCEICVKEGKTSKLHIEAGEVMNRDHPPTYYDEDGVIHIHKEKVNKRARIRCSNSHAGWILGATRCPSCEFGEEEKVVWDE